MRISDLSRRTGVPVATIKFYLREGLLPPGQRTAGNRAGYGGQHVHRIQLIKALAAVGRLDLSSVRKLLTAIDGHRLPIVELYRRIHRALPPPEPTLGELAEVRDARTEVDRLLDDVGWQVSADAAERHRLATVLAALRRLGHVSDARVFTPYTRAAERLAEHELDSLPRDGDDRGTAVARSVLLEVAMTALHRMAQEHVATARFAAARPAGAGRAEARPADTDAADSGDGRGR